MLGFGTAGMAKMNFGTASDELVVDGVAVDDEERILVPSTR